MYKHKPAAVNLEEAEPPDLGASCLSSSCCKGSWDMYVFKAERLETSSSSSNRSLSKKKDLILKVLVWSSFPVTFNFRIKAPMPPANQSPSSHATNQRADQTERSRADVPSLKTSASTKPKRSWNTLRREQLLQARVSRLKLRPHRRRKRTMTETPSFSLQWHVSGDDLLHPSFSLRISFDTFVGFYFESSATQ